MRSKYKIQHGGQVNAPRAIRLFYSGRQADGRL